MKVFIISDMEGVAGIVKWQQTDGTKEKRAFHEGRELYTEEINAAVRGAKSAGAKEIVVMDCHGAGEEWTFNSLIPDKLDPDCEFVVQNDWTEYTELLEQGCDAALFVGMHAKAGTPDGVLAHTVSGQAWRELEFNGTSVGETGINAALCGHWNCPVLAVTARRVPQPQGHGADRRAHARLPRGRLVDCLVAVLLLGLGFFGVSTLVIVTPGQDTALTIRNTLRGGRRGGVLTALGVGTGQ